MTLPTIEALDRDGAIRETHDAVSLDTRAGFFRKAAIGGGTVLGSGAIMGLLPELAAAKPSKRNDLKILNFALTLEFLEASFYKEAVGGNALSGDALALAQLVADHEATHVSALKRTIKSLGGRPVSKPSFDFMGTTADQAKFIQTAFTLENEGVHAYLGQAAKLKSKALLRAAASIVTVEARHASAFAILQGDKPFSVAGGSITPAGAFDRGFSRGRILKDLGKTGFIAGS